MLMARSSLKFLFSTNSRTTLGTSTIGAGSLLLLAHHAEVSHFEYVFWKRHDRKVKGLGRGSAELWEECGLVAFAPPTVGWCEDAIVASCLGAPEKLYDGARLNPFRLSAPKQQGQWLAMAG
jgi:hypothetical protein